MVRLFGGETGKGVWPGAGGKKPRVDLGFALLILKFEKNVGGYFVATTTSLTPSHMARMKRPVQRVSSRPGSFHMAKTTFLTHSPRPMRPSRSRPCFTPTALGCFLLILAIHPMLYSSLPLVLWPLAASGPPEMNYLFNPCRVEISCAYCHYVAGTVLFSFAEAIFPQSAQRHGCRYVRIKIDNAIV